LNVKNRLPAPASCVLPLPLAGCRPQPGIVPRPATAPLSDADAEAKDMKAIEKLVRDEEEGKPVVTVDLSDTPVTDAGLKKLAALKELQELNLTSNLQGRAQRLGTRRPAPLDHLVLPAGRHRPLLREVVRDVKPTPGPRPTPGRRTRRCRSSRPPLRSPPSRHGPAL